tara:strand:+ start:9142 stop:10845 length:1704 start_codon:yes stop_codon:yes gene_type:complete
MKDDSSSLKFSHIETFKDFALKADYSFINTLKSDPQSTIDGIDHKPREVYSGHYVPVIPKAISSPEYVSHSEKLFNELGLSYKLINDRDFCKFFSGDYKVKTNQMKNFGWATGYALSIYGKEYTHQCPFRTGNGYGDGRALSIFEGIFKGQRWEMQLKGSGPTPYCRGADGRAVLRSSIREFLVQEFMHALGVPTTRSLTLFVSQEDTVCRPWYKKESKSFEPEVMVENLIAITTRVAPSFLRVGQIELFARRVKNNSHNDAFCELQMIVKHLIDRNYQSEINNNINFSEKVIEVARIYRKRLTSLVANWIRVGYCQGNFNSDNCAIGGYTLDYGPFGFCELFDPRFQPWTGGGDHFSFFNQPVAAEYNFKMFCLSLKPLIEKDKNSLESLERIMNEFSKCMEEEMQLMWSKKLGLDSYDENLVNNLFNLMIITNVDYTKFFRILSEIPNNVTPLKESFYKPCYSSLEIRWNEWINSWRNSLVKNKNFKDISKSLLLTNPKYTWREWLIAPAYEKAEKGDYSLVKELQNIFDDPYGMKSTNQDKKFDCLRPNKYFNAGGISHYSCSS